MSGLATKRIYRDYKQYYNSNLAEQGIYCIMDETDINIMRAMIVGPKDTPYEGGCYYFLFRFPKNYPFSPPHVTIETRDRRVRINPNFYTCGKVCLSILNTWPGEKWTSACSLSSVLLTLQSRFNEHPIVNEPGYEKSANTTKSNDYNKVLRWYNIEVGAFHSLVNPPPTFECFFNEVRLEFCRHYKNHIKYLTSIYNEDNTAFRSRIYSCTAILKPFLFASKLNDLYTTIYPMFKDLLQTEEIEETVNTEVKEEPSQEKQSKKWIRRVPKEKATSLAIGTKMKSESTGDMYIVSERKDGRKMWKKLN